jgi:hypothetical protein
VIGGASALVVICLIILIVKLTNKGPKRGPERPVLTVDREAAPGERTFNSIEEALKKAKAGDRIRLAPGKYEEKIVLRKVKGITLEAEKGKVVIVKPELLGDDDPLLEIEGTEGIHIKGITFDGQDKLQYLVSINLANPGLTLEKLALKNFKDHAVVATNARGKPGQPLRLMELTTTPTGWTKLQAPVVFQINPKIPVITWSDHIEVRGCRFGGAFSNSNPIQFAPRVFGSDVKLKNNKPETSLGAVTQVLTVDQRAKPGPSTYPTIKAALDKTADLDKARAGIRIRLAPGNYAENIVMRKVKGITLEAVEGEVVILPPPPPAKNDPLLVIEDAADVYLKGIKFDGQKKLPNLVSITGNNPGLTLENLKLVQFTEHAVTVTSATGKTGNPLRLLDLKTEPTPNVKLQGAVVFAVNPARKTPPKNDHILVRGCQFAGTFGNDHPIQFAPGVFGTDVHFTNNTPETPLKIGP